MKHNHLSTIVMALLFAVSACSSDMKANLGLKKDSPDEFRVLAAPPLTVPPDFDLRPPSAAGSSLTPGQASAKQLLSGSVDNVGTPAPTESVKATALPSGADQKLIEKAGASTANSSIRDIIAKDNQPVQDDKKGGFFKNLLSSGKSDDAPVVDAAAEKQRITDNTKNNKPVTTGDTPTVKENKSLWDKLFGHDE